MPLTDIEPPPIIRQLAADHLKIPDEVRWHYSDLAGDHYRYVCLCQFCSLREPVATFHPKGIPVSRVLEDSRFIMDSYRYAYNHSIITFWLGQCPDCLTVFWSKSAPVPV